MYTLHQHIKKIIQTNFCSINSAAWRQHNSTTSLEPKWRIAYYAISHCYDDISFVILFLLIQKLNILFYSSHLQSYFAQKESNLQPVMAHRYFISTAWLPGYSRSYYIFYIGTSTLYHCLSSIPFYRKTSNITDLILFWWNSTSSITIFEQKLVYRKFYTRNCIIIVK